LLTMPWTSSNGLIFAPRKNRSFILFVIEIIIPCQNQYNHTLVLDFIHPREENTGKR